jgi:hypothetical protein
VPAIDRVICVGSQRAGTTWLFRLLTLSSVVATPKLKEIDFFRDLGNWRLGWDWYQDMLRSSGDCVTLDVTPEYLKDRRALSRIAEHAPDARVIVMLRHPVTRTVSAILKLLDEGRVRAPVEYFLKYDIDGCVSRSFVARDIEYLREIGVDPLILFFEEIETHPEMALQRVADATGIPIERRMREALREKTNSTLPSGAKVIKLLSSRLQSSKRGRALKQYLASVGPVRRGYSVVARSATDSPRVGRYRSQVESCFNSWVNEEIDALSGMGIDVSAWWVEG